MIIIYFFNEALFFSLKYFSDLDSRNYDQNRNSISDLYAAYKTQSSMTSIANFK